MEASVLCQWMGRIFKYRSQHVFLQSGLVSGFSKKIINTTSAVSLGALLFAAGVSAAEPVPGAHKTSFAPPESTTSRPSLEGIARGLPAGRRSRSF